MPADPQRIQSIFLAAIESTDPADRAVLLARECGDDAELRQGVEALLQAHNQGNAPPHSPDARPPQTGSYRPAGAGDIAPPTPSHTEGPGSRIGPYKLLQEIGEGGMGIVYMAEQEQPVHRRVALKIIKPGMDSKQVVARFEVERQALALMDHVNIARVLDASTTATGRPYFVMELVKGIPITKYCDDNRLTPRERLELFIPVCQAIQHAHQKGIIHRDIKPSNVLVTLYDGKPVPKVIDFGVAKALDQRLTEKTMFTAFGQVVGTLEYMSPEQAEMNALDIDTRSDIYSLGVLLYELLTGSTPLDRRRLRQAAMNEALRLIREEEPPKPSTRLSGSGEALTGISAQRKTEPRKLPGLVRGDLDWIVMKALEKDRTRRYETANGFGMDIQRYLHDEPVFAGSPSASYRLRKFVRRNRGSVVVATALTLSLVAGAALSTWQAVRARRAEQRVVNEKAVANALNKFLIEDLLTGTDPTKTARGRNVTVEEVLDRASKKVGNNFADQPEVEAAARWAIGTSYLDLTLVEKAEPHLQRALELRQHMFGDENVDTLAAIHSQARLLSWRGKWQECVELGRRELEICRRLFGSDHMETLKVQANLAIALRRVWEKLCNLR